MALAGCGKSEPARAARDRSQSTLPQFREQDYEAARAEALRMHVPLFVDVWASWCHTCMSMKEYVFRDAALAPLANSFVWLALDSERADSAPFLERFKSTSLPTLWVIDPVSQRPLLKWIGAATASELATLLQDARRDFGREPAPAAATQGELSALRLRADRASAAGDAAQAIELYRGVLARAASDFPDRSRVVEALSMRLSETHRDAECVQLAAREANDLPKGTALVNVLVNAISAAAQLPATSLERSVFLPALIKLATQRVADPELRVLVDDRSGLYLALVESLAAEDKAHAKRLAADWAALLEAEAASARSSAARRVWDPHRLEAYLALEQPERALPMLEQSERELPADFNAPARLARARLAQGQLGPARAAIDRALPRCTGPRKLRLYLLKTDILLGSQDREGARGTLTEALTFARSAKLPARYDSVRQQIERRLQELS